MVTDTKMQTLPSGPATLSFNKDDFMREDFNVDQFVMECRRRVPLETLRDDLSLYLKILQTAMIELINKDYADFVNLSTNLVGLDKAINTLTTPLEELKQQVQVVSEALQGTVGAVEEKLHKQAQIRQNKTCMKRLLNIVESVEKIEKLLGIHSGSDDTGGGQPKRELTGQLIERMATEFNKLQFHVNKSRGLPMVEEIRPRIATITSSLQYNLEGSFVEGLEVGQVNMLRQCLRTYSTIDKTRDAENLFRQHVVRDYIEAVISEQSLSSDPLGLQGMYKKILHFIPSHCVKLRQALTSSSKQDGGESVRGYDFLVNAVWPEIVANIEARTPSIFAPGNPKVFHERYTISMDFLSKFERECGTVASVKRLRAHPSYNTFISRWSLPVYFQIRFQEIAGSLESALMTPFVPAAEGSGFHLDVSRALWDCLTRCWTQEVILSPLSHRFWKLTLQLLTRYAGWMAELKDTQVESRKKKPGHQKRPSNAETSINPELEAVSEASQTMSRVNSAPVLARDVTPDDLDLSPAGESVTSSQVVMLVADASSIAKRLTKFYDEQVKDYLEAQGLLDHTALKEALAESQSSIEEHCPSLGLLVIQDVTDLCSGHLRQVGDIPRLYRRTNREVPSKPSAYVSSTLKPLMNFASEHQSVLPEETKLEWILSVVNELSNQYTSITTDVLTSVKKMEESLKRLKKNRKAAAAAGMSDDDKIRLQLSLDVNAFHSQVGSIHSDIANAENLKKLLELVQEAQEGTSAN